jgi:hypothetical protein
LASVVRGNPVRVRDCPRSGEWRRTPSDALARTSWEATATRKTHESEDLPNAATLVERGVARRPRGEDEAMTRPQLITPTPELRDRSRIRASARGRGPVHETERSDPSLAETAPFREDERPTMQIITTRLRPLLAVVGLTTTLSLSACDSEAEGDTESETGDDQSLEIVGDYVDDFGGEHSISETEWTNFGVFSIAEWDNEARFVLAQNHPDNEFNPELWSRFDWTWDGDQLFYCQSVFDGETIEDARSGGADADDLAAGCGMFPWSTLTPQ